MPARAMPVARQTPKLSSVDSSLLYKYIVEYEIITGWAVPGGPTSLGVSEMLGQWFGSRY